MLAGVVGYAGSPHFLRSVRFGFDASATHKAYALLGEFTVTGASAMAVTALVIAAATDVPDIAALPARALAAAANVLLVFMLRRYLVCSHE